MVLYLWATEQAELYKSRPNSPNQNLNRIQRQHTSNTQTHSHTHVHSKKPGKSIKDYFRSFFCTLICLQLIFFLADETKRNEPSRAELSKSNKKIKKKVKLNEKKNINRKENNNKTKANASKGTSDRHNFHCRKVRQMDNNNYYDHNDDDSPQCAESATSWWMGTARIMV